MSSSDRFFNQLPEILFGDIVELLSEKVSSSEITLQNYISTENMIPNCGGVVKASSLPKATKFNSFYESDTLFSNIRTYFRKVWSAEFSGGASADVLIFRSKDRTKLDPLFLYYLVSNKEFVDFTDRTSKGAKMPRGDKDAIVKYPLHLPSVDEQKSIVSVLGALDDKIENNRRMNETLEEMARAIFKSWFVDFDPVHAKAAGNAPAHMDADTAALFPSSFGDDGLPTGWGRKKLEDVMELAYGKALKASNRVEGQVPVYGSGGITGSHNEALVDGPSVIIGRKGTVGSLFWEDRPFFPIDTSFYLKPKIDLTFCYYLLQTLKLDNMNTDAAVPGLNRNNVYRLEFTMPSQNCLSEFQKVVGLMRRKIRSNSDETQTLATLRDTLLPKLMSGEIRVADAEREVEAAV